MKCVQLFSRDRPQVSALGRQLPRSDRAVAAEYIGSGRPRGERILITLKCLGRVAASTSLAKQLPRAMSINIGILVEMNEYSRRFGN